MLLRVLMLTPEFLPVYGGVGNYVLQIARNMPEDISVRIVTPRYTDKAVSDLPEPATSLDELPSNVEVVHLGRATDAFFSNFSFQLNCSQIVRQLVRQGKVDIVHSQSAMPDFLVSPRRLSVPIVTTMHTTVQGHSTALRQASSSSDRLSSSERFVLLLGPILKQLESRYYTDRRFYITVSEWARKMMIDEQGLDPARIRVIRIGVDGREFNPSKIEDARSRFPGLAKIQTPRILYLSRMATRKGIDVLLKAAKRVLAQTDVHFILAGSGDKPSIAIPQQSYTYLGHVPRDAPPGLYAISEIFVLPSFYENFPACLLEAMASECAVVSTRVGGIPEMIDDGKNGRLTNAGDVQALADALIGLAEDDATRERLGRAARESVVARFDWKKTALETAQYYREVVDAHRAEKKMGAGWSWRL